MTLAYFSWIAVFSLSGFICTMVDDRRVLADELAGLDQPLGDRAGDRRPDDGVGQLLLRQLVRGAAILQAGLQAADVVERRLIVRLGDLEARFRGVAVDLRQQAAAARAARARSNALRASSRFAIAWRTDAICSSAGGSPVLPAVDPELRFDLPQRALGAVERELQLARLEPDEHVAGPDLGAELHADVAHDPGDLAADACLIGGDQRAGQVDLALDGHPLDGRGLGLRPPARCDRRGRRRGRRAARGLARRLVAPGGERREPEDDEQMSAHEVLFQLVELP